MKQEWSRKWVSSKQPRKQRKYRHNAPLHIRRKFVSASLSPELRKQVGKRSVPIRKGDEVLVAKGGLRGNRGIVERVDLKKLKIYMENIKFKRLDGREVLRALQPSNLRIIKLNLNDKKRFKKEVKVVVKPAEAKPELKLKEEAK